MPRTLLERPAAPVEPTELDATTAADLAATFRMLADAARLQILYHLAGSIRPSVGELAKLIGHTQPAVSHHLSLLTAAKLIRSDREGRFCFHRLTELGRQTIEAARLLQGG